MSPIDTLFGGMLVIMALYFGLRMIGLANYWRGVISAALPMAAYIAYSAVDWPGGEMVSMHVAVYLGTATVLTIIGSSKNDKGGIHWVPKILVGFFGVLFVVQAIFMYVATSGVPLSVASWLMPDAKNKSVYTAFPGVVPHGQEAAEAVGPHLAEVHRQRQLGWHVSLQGLTGLRQGASTPLQVTLTDKTNNPIDDAEVTLSFVRPAMDKDDQDRIPMQHLGRGVYQALVKLQQPGLWIAGVRVNHGSDVYEADQTIQIPKAE